MTPCRALYGREAPHLLRSSHGSTTLDSLDQWLQERDAILDDLHANMLKPNTE